MKRAMRAMAGRVMASTALSIVRAGKKRQPGEAAVLE